MEVKLGKYVIVVPPDFVDNIIDLDEDELDTYSLDGAELFIADQLGIDPRHVELYIELTIKE